MSGLRWYAAIGIMLGLMPWRTCPAQPSVLASGNWFRVAVEKDGIYEINYDMLLKLGLNPANIHPQNFRLFGFPTGMLPQANSAQRPDGLQEIAVWVTGARDGRFNRNDKILFYGQGPDNLGYNRERNFFTYENNLYSDRNFYYITADAGPGLRTTARPTITVGEVVTTYQDLFLEDTDRVNILKSGRDWFGIDFDANTIAALSWDMDRVVPGSDVKLVTRLMAEAYEPASFRISYNNQQVGEYALAAIPATSYGVKGRTRLDTAATTAATSGKHQIKLEYIRTGTNYSIGRLDYLMASVKRTLGFSGKSLLFFATEATNPETQMEITTTVPATVWDITDPFRAFRQQHFTINGSIRFTINGNGPVKRFAVFDTLLTQLKPIAIGRVPNQDLRTPQVADVVTIAHPLFIPAAQRLAEHRVQNDGLVTWVVSTEEIYHEFSGGRQDVSALRDFLRRVQLNGGRLQHVLLFGRGSYDYRNITADNTSLVPVYESRNSLFPLETYSSDDFFGFLEAGEGEWKESPPEFHTLDIGVGRIPCVTAAEAEAAVDKLIAYDADPGSRGSWRKEVVFVADDGDSNIHQNQADALADRVETMAPELRASRLFVDDFKQIQKSFGQLSPEGAAALFRTFHEGAAIINFTGHGSEQLWMAERMLDPEQIARLENRKRLPFVVTATCEFGRADDPAVRSSAEKLLLHPFGGAVGLVTTARPVSSATNFEINKDFYDALLVEGHNQSRRMGSAFKQTKNTRNSGISNRNFALMGDPAMRIGLPSAEAVLSEPSLDLSADEWVLFGQIRNGGQRWADYQGEAQVEIYAPQQERITRGDENNPYSYLAWKNPVWKGLAEVSDGLFSVRFRLADDVPTGGKIFVHVTGAKGFPDAGGLLPIGEITASLVTGNIPPSAQLFVNDSTFRDGNLTGASPVMYARMTDDTGLDLAGNMTLTLDGDTVYYVNAYAEALPVCISCPPSYQLRFPLFDLSDGPHEAVLSVADIQGQTASTSVKFNVGKDDFGVVQLNGYPNPFSGETALRFEHTRPGDDLEGRLTITDAGGQPLREMTFFIPEGTAQSEILIWDGTDAQGHELPPGIYFLQADVRSVQHGAKKRVFGKLILVN